jgi:hypothetical protein
MSGAGGQILQNFQTYIIGPAIVLVFTAGLLVFMYGLVEFMIKVRESSDHKQGVQHMLWGLVGMLIMVSVGTILAIIQNTIGPGSLDPARINVVQPITGVKLFN